MRLLYYLPLVWLMACASMSIESGAYRTIGITAHTVSLLMENWADASVAGRTSPEVDAKVTAYYTAYQKSATGVKIAVEAFRAGSGTRDAIDAALKLLADNKAQLSRLIISVVAPEKKAALEKLP